MATEVQVVSGDSDLPRKRSSSASLANLPSRNKNQEAVPEKKRRGSLSALSAPAPCPPPRIDLSEPPKSKSAENTARSKKATVDKKPTRLGGSDVDPKKEAGGDRSRSTTKKRSQDPNGNNKIIEARPKKLGKPDDAKLAVPPEDDKNGAKKPAKADDAKPEDEKIGDLPPPRENSQPSSAQSPNPSPKASLETASPQSRKRSPSTTGRLWEMLTGTGKRSRPSSQKPGKRKSNDPPSHYTVTSMNDLPDKVNRLVSSAKLDKNQLQDHFKEFLYVVSYITKDSFRIDPNVPFYQKSEKTPSACEKFRTASIKAMTPCTEKELKKIYKRMEYSAKGGFGRVFSARLQTPKGPIAVAIKRLPHHTDKEKQNNMGELAFLMHCTNHGNIVNFKEAWLLPTDELWIVTEFLEGGTLDLAISCHKFKEQHICYIAHEVLNGLAYLHSLDFAHRDIKSANVMTSISGEVKIIDFGLACDFHSGPRVQLVGSPFWLPPEMLIKEPYKTKVDIWSYGVLILELILGRTPHEHSRLASMMYSAMGTTLAEAVPLIKTYNRTEPSQGLMNYVARCLVKDQRKRASAKKLLEDPWFKSCGDNPREGIEKVLQAVFVSNTLQMHGV